MQKKPVKLGALLLILLIMNGCATFVERKPEDVVRQRAEERWAALIDGRLETAYTYETPEYKELYTFSEFRKKIRGVGSWQKVSIENITCEENKCGVTVRIHVRMRPSLGFEVIETNGLAKENWIYHGASGQWHHVSDN